MFPTLLKRIKGFVGRLRAPKTMLLVAIVFATQLLLGYLVIYVVSANQIESSLRSLNERVRTNIQFDNGSWDISRYNADPEIPGSNRLYVFTSDGFVIERWRPISGYMNASNLRQLLTYQTPQTIQTVTSQPWRMYSLPITDGDVTVGAITVSYFNPNKTQLDQIDRKLQAAADAIQALLNIRNGEISVKSIDSRAVSYDISFQVVNQYNRILAKSDNANSMGGAPDFIDATFVERSLGRTSQVRQVQEDGSKNETFLTVTEPLTDSEGTVRGVVISARSINHIFQLRQAYVIANIILGAVIIVAATSIFAIGNSRRKRMNNPDPEKTTTESPDKQPASTTTTDLMFSKSQSAIIAGSRKIPLTYASNQYYMCQALFSSPKKRWETDELMERFGEQHNGKSWRKAYDAAAGINKKARSVVGTDLIVSSNKTFQINPTLSNNIQRSNQK